MDFVLYEPVYARAISLSNSDQFLIVDQEDFEVLKDLIISRNAQTGYAQFWSKEHKQAVTVHRFIMGLETSGQIDHKNRNRLDCRRANLRIATVQQNIANSGKRKGNFSSKYKGVFRSGHQWKASIQMKGVVHHLGIFDSEEEAGRAYDNSAKEFFGEYANLNFPPKQCRGNLIILYRK